MPFPSVIVDRLRAAGINENMPAWSIVRSAQFLPPVPHSNAIFGDSVPQALTKLMNSFFEYGRRHWTWSQASPATASGGGLVKGLTTAVACASFNQNFKWLAEQVLGITGIMNKQFTQQFLTHPGQMCIDSKWVGNVRTSRRTFMDLRCFKFREHYWVAHGVTNYDVCFNRTFSTDQQVVWTRLLDPDKRLFGRGGLEPGQIFRLETPDREGDHLVMIQMFGPNGWPSWQIVPRDEVAKLRKLRR